MPPAAATASGYDIVSLAAAHVGEEYVFGARAPLANPNWRGPWDCAEFASWCLYQTASIIYGARPKRDPVAADPYTGYWAEDARADHQAFGNVIVPVEVAARTAGAFLLREPGSGGQVGHIAISDGRGRTVEAMSTSAGVAQGQISGRYWDYGVLIPGLRYLMNEIPIPIERPRTLIRVTSPLMHGPVIEEVQRRLLALGYNPGAVDGVYGGQTAQAIAAFQSDQGLVVDGEVGDETAQRLRMAG